jgi:PHD/YefM family antitoxin component YafN of YafNO toxin-antitoxin module
MIDASEKVLRISHLREVLGYACQQVALTGEPIVVQRYNRQDVVIVPLADWRFYQQMEAELRDADPPDDPLENLPEFLPD